MILTFLRIRGTEHEYLIVEFHLVSAIATIVPQSREKEDDL